MRHVIIVFLLLVMTACVPEVVTVDQDGNPVASRPGNVMIVDTPVAVSDVTQPLPVIGCPDGVARTDYIVRDLSPTCEEIHPGNDAAIVLAVICGTFVGLIGAYLFPDIMRLERVQGK